MQFSEVLLSCWWHSRQSVVISMNWSPNPNQQKNEPLIFIIQYIGRMGAALGIRIQFCGRNLECDEWQGWMEMDYYSPFFSSPSMLFVISGEPLAVESAGQGFWNPYPTLLYFQRWRRNWCYQMTSKASWKRFVVEVKVVLAGLSSDQG